MENNNRSETKVCFEQGSVKIHYSVVAKTKENGKMICVIPGFNLLFSASNDDEVRGRSAAMLKTYVQYYKEEESFQSFVKNLHCLGFRAPEKHAYLMKELLNKRPTTAKFKSNTAALPPIFDDGRRIENTVEEMAY